MLPMRFLFCLCVLSFVSTPMPAIAISEYKVSIHATMALEGPAATDIIQVLDLNQRVVDDSDTTGFPSFTFSDGSATWDPATHTLTVIAAANGAANFAGGIPQAIASGMTRTGATLVLINPSEDIGFFIDVRVQATFEYSGLLSNVAEFAETIFDLQFVGNRLDGLPVDGTIVSELRTTTTDPGLENGFSLVTTTFILGFDETYSIRIPPGVSESDYETLDLEILDLGLFAQGGGAAASRINGSAIMALEFLPESPKVFKGDEFRGPEIEDVPFYPDLAIPETSQWFD